MTEKTNVLQTWWEAATKEEREEMARAANTSVESLRQEAFAYRHNGQLRVSLAHAAYYASASRRMYRNGLPVIDRGDLCPIWNDIDLLDKNA